MIHAALLVARGRRKPGECSAVGRPAPAWWRRGRRPRAWRRPSVRHLPELWRPELWRPRWRRSKSRLVMPAQPGRPSIGLSSAASFAASLVLGGTDWARPTSSGGKRSSRTRREKKAGRNRRPQFPILGNSRGADDRVALRHPLLGERSLFHRRPQPGSRERQPMGCQRSFRLKAGIQTLHHTSALRDCRQPSLVACHPNSKAWAASSSK